MGEKSGKPDSLQEDRLNKYRRKKTGTFGRENRKEEKNIFHEHARTRAWEKKEARIASVADNKALELKENLFWMGRFRGKGRIIKKGSSIRIRAIKK